MARNYTVTSTTTTRKRLTHPSEYADLRLRLVASEGLYTTSAYAALASADLDPVGVWCDRTHPAHKYEQATAGKRAQLILAATPAGGPAVRFASASSQYLALAGNTDLIAGNRTVICACRFTSIAGLGVLVGASDSNWYAGVLNTAKTTMRHLKADTAAQSTSAAGSTLSLSTWYVLAYRHTWDNGNNVTATMWRNGTQLVSTSYTTGITLPTATTWHIGSSSGAAGFLDGDIAELNVYGDDLTDAEIALLTYDLMREHGITGS